MRFGPVPVAEAEGAVLAHSIRLGKGTFKKGRRLSVEDVAALAALGTESVIAARLDPDDVPEDAAAAQLAAALHGDGASASAAFTGRANLLAEAAGVVVVDTERLDRINLLDEAVTVGTLAPFAVVEPGQMVATVKIIPFAAPRAVVEEACAIAREASPVLRVAAFAPKRVGLLQSRLAGMKESILDKTVRVTEERLAPLGATLVAELRSAHEEAAVADGIARLAAERCDIVLVAGASAIVDRRDVIPAAIERAGGTVLHFGMPVDPGNLLLLGRLGAATVLGLPGCARSPKLNGFDWVLQRLAADVAVTRRDIMRMGAGGLLTEISSRPQPRAEAPAGESTIPRAPRIAAVVLAAGLSRRMGAPKLLAEIEGRAMVAHVVDAVQASRARPIIVVVPAGDTAVRAALAGHDVTFVENPEAPQGLSTSVRRGLRAVPPAADGAVICLGDMPRLRAEHVDRLLAGFSPVEGRAICVPTFNGRRGNPVLWSRRFFDEMQGLSGDTGAKRLLQDYAELVAEVPVGDDGVLVDIDTPEALASIRGAALRA